MTTGDERISWQCPGCEQKFRLKPAARRPKLCPTCRRRRTPAEPEDFAERSTAHHRDVCPARSRRFVFVCTVLVIALIAVGGALFFFPEGEPVRVLFWYSVTDGVSGTVNDGTGRQQPVQVGMLLVRIRAPLDEVSSSLEIGDETKTIIQPDEDDWVVTLEDGTELTPMPAFLDGVKVNDDGTVDGTLQFLILEECSTSVLRFRQSTEIRLNDDNHRDRGKSFDD